jgi:ketosteroid isomerase-like protein
MRSRLAPVLALLLIITACAPAPAPEPEPEMDEAAVVAAILDDYVVHYNLGHADMVADFYTDTAVALLASGSVNMGREAIQVSIELAMANGPTLSIESADTMVMGDNAVSRGSYSVEIAAEGADPVSFGGSYMTRFERVDGEWKISAGLSNYDGPPAEGVPSAPALDSPEVPEDMTEGPLVTFAASYVEHFNMGHPAVVAAMYADDAVAAFADGPLLEGNAAIEAALTERADGVAQLAIHVISADDLGDGWHFGGGRYEVTDEDEQSQVGNWIGLVSTDEDGTHKFVWAISNMVHGEY